MDAGGPESQPFRPVGTSVDAHGHGLEIYGLVGGGMALVPQEGVVQIVIAVAGAVVGGLVGLLIGSWLAVVLQEGWPLQMLPRGTSWIVALATLVGGVGGVLGGMVLVSREGVVQIVTSVVGGLVGIYLGYRVAWSTLNMTPSIVTR